MGHAAASLLLEAHEHPGTSTGQQGRGVELIHVPIMVRGACICHRGAGDVRQEVLGRMRGCGLREEGSKARSTGVMGVGTGRIVMTGQACQQTTQGSGCSLRPHQREDKATDHCDDTSWQYCSRILSLATQCAAAHV